MIVSRNRGCVADGERILFELVLNLCERASLRIGVALVPDDGLTALKFYPVLIFPHILYALHNALAECFWKVGGMPVN